MEVKTYYLSSMDSIRFAETRECSFLRKLVFTTGKECIMARIDPPAIGQPYGLGAEDLEYVFLASRSEGESLDPIASFPCFVFIARPLVSDLEVKEIVDRGDLEVIAWGEIYRTRHDAENHVFD